MNKSDFRVFANIPNQIKVEYYKDKPAHDMICQHYHQEYEIMLMTEGKRNMSFNGVKYTMEKGDLVIVSPFVMHYTSSPTKQCYTRYLLNFSPQFLRITFSDEEVETLTKSLSSTIYHLADKEYNEFLVLFNQLCAHYDMNPPFSTTVLRSEIYSFCQRISELPTRDIVAKDIVAETVSENMHDTMIYIFENFQTDISLDEAAKRAALSKSHFCYSFKKETGITFLQFVNNLRTSYVHKLLLETDMSLAAIAEDAGFHSVAMMNRVFHDTHHISPSEFRRRNRPR